MRRLTRRAVLGCLPVVAAGCSSDPTGSLPNTDDEPTTGGTASGTAGGTTTGTAGGTTTGTAGGTTTSDTGVPFEDLSTAGMPTECLRFDYAYYATTPAPSPTPAAPPSETGAVELATAYERAYLRNWVVLNENPVDESTGTAESPTPSDESPTGTTQRPTANPPTYPAITAEYAARKVLGRTDRGAVVALRYDRILGGETRPRESLGRYTVTYYLTDEATARAETAGDERPGPHPTEEGVLLSCE